MKIWKTLVVTLVLLSSGALAQTSATPTLNDPNRSWDLITQSKGGEVKIQRGFSKAECEKILALVKTMIPNAVKETDPVKGDCFQP